MMADCVSEEQTDRVMNMFSKGWDKIVIQKDLKIESNKEIVTKV
jgi:hypothetical protein